MMMLLKILTVIHREMLLKILKFAAKSRKAKYESDRGKDQHFRKREFDKRGNSARSR